MKSTDLRVGIVGAGRMGADHIKRITESISGAVVTAVVEPDAGRATEALADAPAARGFFRVEDAIEADAIDAVVIATPGKYHEPVLLPVLEAGLPVLCEKPLTPDSESALRVVEAEQKLDRPHIQVGFMRRFDLEYRQLRELIASEDLGKLLMLRCKHRNPDVPPDYFQDMLIFDSVVHEFDVAPWLAGSSLRNISVRHGRRNSHAPEKLREPILVLAELENDVLVDVEMNVNVNFGYQVSTEAVFERGVARIGEPSGMQVWKSGACVVKEHESFVTRFAATYDTQVQDWVDAVRSGELIAGPNAWEGYQVARACEAGVRALHEGGQIDIESQPKPDFYK